MKANLDSHRLVLGADPATLGLATMAAESLGVTGRFDDASSLDLDSVGRAGAVFGPPTAADRSSAATTRSTGRVSVTTLSRWR